MNQKVEVIRCHDCNAFLTDESVCYVKRERSYCETCALRHTTGEPDILEDIKDILKEKWGKLVGGSLLIASGVYSLIEAGKAFDEVGGLVFIGVPAVIIGIVLVIKATQELLSR